MGPLIRLSFTQGLYAPYTATGTLSFVCICVHVTDHTRECRHYRKPPKIEYFQVTVFISQLKLFLIVNFFLNISCRTRLPIKLLTSFPALHLLFILGWKLSAQAIRIIYVFQTGGSVHKVSLPQLLTHHDCFSSYRTDLNKSLHMLIDWPDYIFQYSFFLS